MAIKHFFLVLLLAPGIVFAQSVVPASGSSSQGKKETKKEPTGNDVDISVVEQGDMQKYQVILPGD